MRTAVITTIILILGFVHEGKAFMDDPDPASLRGAPRVANVTIADLGPEAGRSGLTAERMYGTVAAQVTAAGFRVDETAPAVIHVGLGLSPVRGAGLVAYSVRFSFDQQVLLERDSAVRVSAPTWLVVHTGTAFSAKLADNVLGALEGLGQRFLNNFDAENPQGG